MQSVGMRDVQFEHAIPRAVMTSEEVVTPTIDLRASGKP
jgi:hypothetical protein